MDRACALTFGGLWSIISAGVEGQAEVVAWQMVWSVFREAGTVPWKPCIPLRLLLPAGQGGAQGARAAD